MKNWILLLGLLFVFSSPVLAEETTKTADVTTENSRYSYLFEDASVEYTDKDIDTNTENSAHDQRIMAEADLPYLIKLTPNVFIGGSAAKDLKDTNAKEGWEFKGKVTILWTLLDFSKK